MRLQRVGRRNDPSYRVVVTDRRTGPKSYKHVALLGSYNPKMDHVQIDTEAAADWLKKGVQPSETVHNILVGLGVLDKPKVNPLPRKSPIGGDQDQTEGGTEESDTTEEVQESQQEDSQKEAAEFNEETSQSDDGSGSKKGEGA